MSIRQWWNVVKRSSIDINNHNDLAFAAALSYYFVISLFPALIALAAVVSLLPIPNLFQNIVDMVGRVVPAEGMSLVNQVAADVIRPRSGGLLTFGLIATIWSASSGFAGMIDALDVAYCARETRPWWETRVIAICLTFAAGSMMVVAFLCMTIGPRFFELFADKIGYGPQFLLFWKFARWVIAAVMVVVSVEVIFFLAPNVRQRFRDTLPGAIFSVIAWILLSAGLGIYFGKFAHFNATYGTLGAVVALLIWMYWTSLAIICGGELNSELIQERARGKISLLERPVQSDSPQFAA